jgi:hypothetical protein
LFFGARSAFAGQTFRIAGENRGQIKNWVNSVWEKSLERMSQGCIKGGG